jgi:hypothetical protein
MKNTFLLLLFLSGFLINTSAQSPEYDDLKIYFADADFEKLLKKAEKYTLGDDTRKDAVPYLFLSKANFEISKGVDEELSTKYPRAFKDALKYAGKSIQKDKEGIVYLENMAHFTNLKIVVTEKLRNLAESGDYGRLMGSIPSMLKIDKNDIGSYYLKAAGYYHKKDMTGMKKSAKIANDLLDAADSNAYSISENDDYDLTNKKKIDLEMLKLGIIHYSQALVLARQKPMAKDLMGKVKQWFPETPKNSDFTDAYDTIVN